MINSGISVLGLVSEHLAWAGGPGTWHWPRGLSEQSPEEAVKAVLPLGAWRASGS